MPKHGCATFKRLRAEALKRRDDGAETMILLVADTRHNRQVIRLAKTDLVGDFPIAGAAVLAAVCKGERPAGSGILFL